MTWSREERTDLGVDVGVDEKVEETEEDKPEEEQHLEEEDEGAGQAGRIPGISSGNGA